MRDIGDTQRSRPIFGPQPISLWLGLCTRSWAEWQRGQLSALNLLLQLVQPSANFDLDAHILYGFSGEREKIVPLAVPGTLPAPTCALPVKATSPFCVMSLRRGTRMPSITFRTAAKFFGIKADTKLDTRWQHMGVDSPRSVVQLPKWFGRCGDDYRVTAAAPDFAQTLDAPLLTVDDIPLERIRQSAKAT